jgi:hypothetical protein
MKTKIFIFILFLLGSIGTMAQSGQQKEVTTEEITRMLVNRLGQKVELTKNQKDSITVAYTQFMDEIQKYRAENNAKVLTFLTKSRDDKVKNILHDDQKYDKYLLFLADVNKQRPPQQGNPPPQQQQGQGQQHQMGNGRGM